MSEDFSQAGLGRYENRLFFTSERYSSPPNYL